MCSKLHEWCWLNVRNLSELSQNSNSGSVWWFLIRKLCKVLRGQGDCKNIQTDFVNIDQWVFIEWIQGDIYLSDGMIGKGNWLDLGESDRFPNGYECAYCQAIMGCYAYWIVIPHLFISITLFSHKYPMLCKYESGWKYWWLHVCTHLPLFLMALGFGPLWYCHTFPFDVFPLTPMPLSLQWDSLCQSHPIRSSTTWAFSW